MPRAWEGGTAYIVAGGPSVACFKGLGEQLAGRRVIAINNSWELIPDADILYAGDANWWAGHNKGATERRLDQALREFRGRWMVTIAKQESIRHSRLSRLNIAVRERQLSVNPTELVMGSNSGYQAINLAALLGVSRMVLIGYDLQAVPPKEAPAGDPGHWHSGHPGQDPAKFEHRVRTTFLPRLRTVREPLEKLGIEVVHGRPEPDPVGTAADWWPRRPLCQLLH